MNKNQNNLNDYIKVAEQVSVPVFFVDDKGGIVSMNNYMSDLVRKGLAEESIGTNLLRYKSYQENGSLQ